MPDIDYVSNSFPTGTIPNGSGSLSVTWDDILWAAVTVGRPNRHFVRRHGVASEYEAIFRWSLVRMALEQTGPRGSRLYRTTAFKTLDPTEKGAINYFLGMAFCKLFSDKLLGCPWLLHLDVFRPQLNPILTGRSRPDLVGENPISGQWSAFESKGRSSPPSTDAKNKAKSQVQRLVSVNGPACSLHIGAITYFKRDILNFYWEDPEPEPKNSFEVSTGKDPWRNYYQPIADLISANDGWSQLQRFASLDGESPYFQATSLGVDLGVSVEPKIAAALSREEWSLAHDIAVSQENDLLDSGFQRDGLKIKAGSSWLVRFEENES
jgi:hypothetical protein